MVAAVEIHVGVTQTNLFSSFHFSVTHVSCDYSGSSRPDFWSWLMNVLHSYVIWPWQRSLSLSFPVCKKVLFHSLFSCWRLVAVVFFCKACSSNVFSQRSPMYYCNKHMEVGFSVEGMGWSVSLYQPSCLLLVLRLLEETLGWQGIPFEAHKVRWPICCYFPIIR